MAETSSVLNSSVFKLSLKVLRSLADLRLYDRQCSLSRLPPSVTYKLTVLFGEVILAVNLPRKSGDVLSLLWTCTQLCAPFSVNNNRLMLLQSLHSHCSSFTSLWAVVERWTESVDY